jgi:hypothetical protein
MRELLVHFSNKLFNVFCVIAIVHLTLSMYPIRVKKENDVDLNSIKHVNDGSLLSAATNDVLMYFVLIRLI